MISRTRAITLLVFTLSCTGTPSSRDGRSGGSTSATGSGLGGDGSSSSGGQGGSGTLGKTGGSVGTSDGGTSGSTTGGSGGSSTSTGGAGIDAGQGTGGHAGGGGAGAPDDGGAQDVAPNADGAVPGNDPLAAGWTPYDPPKEVQIETADVIKSYPYTSPSLMSTGASYDRSNGIETFKLINHDTSNRVEVRVLDNYATGLRQFAGDVRFTAPTDDESMMQVFGETGGSAMLMLKGYAENGGTIAKEGGHSVIATGVYGQWVHVNVIHDATNNKVSVYINGQLKGDFPGKGVGPDRPFHYHKYGCYGTLMTDTAQVQWRNVAYYMK
jgi:hypothetical protein